MLALPHFGYGWRSRAYARLWTRFASIATTRPPRRCRHRYHFGESRTAPRAALVLAAIQQIEYRRERLDPLDRVRVEPDDDVPDSRPRVGPQPLRDRGRFAGHEGAGPGDQLRAVDPVGGRRRVPP